MARFMTISSKWLLVLIFGNILVTFWTALLMRFLRPIFAPGLVNGSGSRSDYVWFGIALWVGATITSWICARILKGSRVAYAAVLGLPIPMLFALPSGPEPVPVRFALLLAVFAVSGGYLGSFAATQQTRRERIEGG